MSPITKNKYKLVSPPFLLQAKLHLLLYKSVFYLSAAIPSEKLNGETAVGLAWGQKVPGWLQQNVEEDLIMISQQQQQQQCN